MKRDLDNAREQLKVGRRELADLLGLTPQQLLSLERGEAPSGDVQEKLRELLDNKHAVRRRVAQSKPPAVASMRWEKSFYYSPHLTNLPWILLPTWVGFMLYAGPGKWIFQAPMLVLLSYVAYRYRKAGPFCSACHTRVRPTQLRCQGCGASFDRSWQ